jgi:hypothetical protein
MSQFKKSFSLDALNYSQSESLGILIQIYVAKFSILKKVSWWNKFDLNKWNVGKTECLLEYRKFWVMKAVSNSPKCVW